MPAPQPVNVGFLADYLNDGQRSGFKAGDAIEFSTPRGNVRRGKVWDKGPKPGERWVQDDGGTMWLVRKARPKFRRREVAHLLPAGTASLLSGAALAAARRA